MLHPNQYPIGRFEKPDTYTETTLRAWIAAIEALPSWLDVLMQNLDAPALHAPYRPGGWSINQIVHHLANSHLNAFVRMKLALTEDSPEIKPYDQDRWAETPEIGTEPVNVSITLLHALHRRWCALMRALTPEQWERTYYHPEYRKTVPLWELCALYAWHGRHHMEQVRGVVAGIRDEG